MTKIMKSVYLLLGAIGVVMSVVSFITGNYTTAAWTTLSIVWVYLMYQNQDRVFSLIAQVQELLVENYLKSAAIKSLKEENVMLLETLKELKERTPARGANGRFEKRKKNDDISKFGFGETNSVVK